MWVKSPPDSYSRQGPGCYAGIRLLSRSGSSPSHEGLVAVASKIDVVLKSSNWPRDPAPAVFAQGLDLGIAHGTKCPRRLECLVEDLHAVDPCDHDGRRLVQGIMQALDGRHDAGPENDAITQALHPQDTNALFDQFGDNQIREAAVVRVHDVDGHLHGRELETMFAGDFEHMQMDLGIFMSCEADVPEFAGLLGLDKGRLRSLFVKDAVRVVVADHLMMLDQVDAVGLQALERLINLASRLGLRPAVDLGHQEDLLAIPVAERLAHADFALTLVVVP